MRFLFGISKKEEKIFHREILGPGIGEFLEILLESHFIVNANHHFFREVKREKCLRTRLWWLFPQLQIQPNQYVTLNLYVREMTPLLQ